MWSTRILVLIVLFCTTCNERVVDEPDDLTASEKAIVSELDELVFSIKGSSPTLTDIDLKPFDAIADARMVGLGEATHGTKEFFEMKHRIFRYLVTTHGFKAIGFESDFAESLIFEDYIQGRSKGDLHTLMNTKMALWPWQALEVQALLEWMKSYNQNIADTDRIHFFGLDCQFVTFNADFLAERIALYDDNLAQYVRTNSVDFKKLDNNGDDTNHKTITASLQSIYDHVVSAGPNLLSKGMPSFDYEIAKRLARNLIQTNDLIYSGKIGGGQEVRDNYMAENAVWLMNVFGNTNKICLWAHNAHISSDGTYFRSMGFTLRDSIGAMYQRIGFGFSRGSFNAIYNGELKPWTISNTPVEESTNFLLANLSAKNFILRLSDIRKSEAVYPWLNQSKKFLQVSAVYGGDPKRSYWGVTIGDFYDVLIYFDETTSSSIF